MTTYDTNTRADLNTRGRRLSVTREAAAVRIRRLLDRLPVLFTRRPADPVEALAKAERREAARRATDSLLLR